MRYLKALTLAIAVFVPMAFAAAPAAMATSTQLCSTDTECGSSGVSSVHLVSFEMLLLSSLVNVECTVLFSGTSLGLGSPLELHGNFTYSDCETYSGSDCTITETSASSLIGVLKIGTEEAEFVLTGEVLVECGSFIHCIFNRETVGGFWFGALSADLTEVWGQVLPKLKGFLCPAKTELHLATESLSALYIKE
jgi:hypothetical protein